MSTPPPPPAPAYVYSDDYLRFDYGPSHPLRIMRLGLAHELIETCGLAQPAYPVRPASEDELAGFHDRRYLETLRDASQDKPQNALGIFGLGVTDNPVFPGAYDWSALLAGASLEAGRLVTETGHPIAFNMAGGMHHGMAARASGFCYVNDAVMVIRELTKQDLRVAYVDLDAHHGDGVQWAFYETDQVLTISLHQHPATLFPGTGYTAEMGRGRGRGYSVNVPLWPDTDDEVYIQCFEAIVPPVIEAFAPDVVVSQLGADAFLDDPLANLNLTTVGFGHCVRRIKQMAPRWVALGGGGYDLWNVARAWTLAWAIMLGREDSLPRRLPQDFVELHQVPSDRRTLLDQPESIRGRYWGRAQRDAQGVIDYLRENLFPLLGMAE